MSHSKIAFIIKEFMGEGNLIDTCKIKINDKV